MTETIRAAVLREFGGPLRIERIELSPPGPGELLVEIDGVASEEFATAPPAAARCRKSATSSRRRWRMK